VLTPHAGEFARLTGREVGPDRFSDVRELARATGCVVLLKGPTTVIASPEGHLRVVTSGTASLATAGTGDVLAGFIGATIARGFEPLEAAALGAHLHGRAGARLAPYAHASEVAMSLARLVGSLARN
jgi:NAD(P)H-hydrate repair Nnr-like enzyme with NAD(P)H-hydrate dehydratase domain